MTKAFLIGFATKTLLTIAIFGLPTVSEAGILSLVTSLFASEGTVTDQAVLSSSQKMPLLEAPVSLNLGSDAAIPLVTVNNTIVPVASNIAPNSNSNGVQGGKIVNYKVKSGDTVLGIAKEFGISANTVIWANGLKKDAKLSIGQNLVILPVNGVQHKVISGDTLLSIASRYKGDIDEIRAYNDIDGDKLAIGDVIVVPDGQLSQSVTATTKKTSSTAKLASVAVGVGSAQASNDASGYYIRPISAGERTQGVHGYNGVDLADACGTPIHASAGGKVSVSINDGGYNGGFGNYVVIDHSNGSQTLYGHMLKTAVTEGSTVTQGQTIGYIGATGKVSGPTGCHVHFEIRNGSTNPF